MVAFSFRESRGRRRCLPVGLVFFTSTRSLPVYAFAVQRGRTDERGALTFIRVRKSQPRVKLSCPPFSVRPGPDGMFGGGLWARGGSAHNPLQRYNRDARYAAIPARRSSAL